MKRKSVAICIIMGTLVVTSCSSEKTSKDPAASFGNNISTISEKRQSETKTTTIREALLAPGKRAWFFVENDKDTALGKDSKPYDVFIFENGKYLHFGNDMLSKTEKDSRKTLGDLTKMNDSEIFAYYEPIIKRAGKEGQQLLEMIAGGERYLSEEAIKEGGIKLASAGEKHFSMEYPSTPDKTSLELVENGVYAKDVIFDLSKGDGSARIKESAEFFENILESKKNPQLRFIIKSDPSGNYSEQEIVIFTPGIYPIDKNMDVLLKTEEGKYLPVLRRGDGGLITYTSVTHALEKEWELVFSNVTSKHMEIYDKTYIMIPAKLDGDPGYLVSVSDKDEYISLDSPKDEGVESDSK